MLFLVAASLNFLVVGWFSVVTVLFSLVGRFYYWYF